MMSDDERERIYQCAIQQLRETRWVPDVHAYVQGRASAYPSTDTMQTYFAVIERRILGDWRQM